MDFKALINAVIDGDDTTVVSQVNMMFGANVAPLDIINNGLLAGMDVVSQEFKDGNMFVPEVLMAANAMNEGMDIVKPHISGDALPNLGTVVIGTVKGDLHDIGKNLVVMMLESSGFKVVNLGTDVTKDAFIKAAKENNANIVGMSAMLTTTMEYMQEVITDCNKEGLKVNYMIGGAPTTPAYGESIGAFYTADSASAVDKAKELVK